jgi:hypothetical protein
MTGMNEGELKLHREKAGIESWKLLSKQLLQRLKQRRDDLDEKSTRFLEKQEEAERKKGEQSRTLETYLRELDARLDIRVSWFRNHRELTTELGRLLGGISPQAILGGARPTAQQPWDGLHLKDLGVQHVLHDPTRPWVFVRVHATASKKLGPMVPFPKRIQEEGMMSLSLPDLLKQPYLPWTVVPPGFLPELFAWWRAAKRECQVHRVGTVEEAINKAKMLDGSQAVLLIRERGSINANELREHARELLDRELEVVAPFACPAIPPDRTSYSDGIDRDVEPCFIERAMGQEWRGGLIDWVAQQLGDQFPRERKEALKAWLDKHDQAHKLFTEPADVLSLCRLLIDMRPGTGLFKFASMKPRELVELATPKWLSGEADYGASSWIKDNLIKLLTRMEETRLDTVEMALTDGMALEQWREIVPGELLQKSAAFDANPDARELVVDHLRHGAVLRSSANGYELCPGWVGRSIRLDRVRNALMGDNLDWALWSLEPARRALVDAAILELSRPDFERLVTTVTTLWSEAESRLVRAKSAIETLFYVSMARDDLETLNVETMHELWRAQMEVLPKFPEDCSQPSPLTRFVTGWGGRNLETWAAHCWQWSHRVDEPREPLDATKGWLFPCWGAGDPTRELLAADCPEWMDITTASLSDPEKWLPITKRVAERLCAEERRALLDRPNPRARWLEAYCIEDCAQSDQELSSHVVDGLTASIPRFDAIRLHLDALSGPKRRQILRRFLDALAKESRRGQPESLFLLPQVMGSLRSKPNLEKVLYRYVVSCLSQCDDEEDWLNEWLEPFMKSRAEANAPTRDKLATAFGNSLALLPPGWQLHVLQRFLSCDLSGEEMLQVVYPICHPAQESAIPYPKEFDVLLVLAKKSWPPWRDNPDPPTYDWPLQELWKKYPQRAFDEARHQWETFCQDETEAIGGDPSPGLWWSSSPKEQHGAIVRYLVDTAPATWPTRLETWVRRLFPPPPEYLVDTIRLLEKVSGESS